MSRTKLAIDATPVVPGRKGLGIFLERLLDAFESQGLSKGLIAYVDRSFFQEASDRWPSFMLRPVRSRPSLLWEQYVLPRRMRADGVSVLLTGRDRTRCEPSAKTLVYLFEIPDYRVDALLKGGAGWRSRIVARHLLRRFRRISAEVSKYVVSSRSTGKDLERHYAVSNARIRLVYPGIDDFVQRLRERPIDKQIVRARFAAARPYVLHFATGDFRDNSDVAVESFAIAAESIDPSVALLLVTRPVVADRLLNLARRLGIEQRVFTTGYLKSDEVMDVIGGADLYLDPTLFEGFGFQLLEAMAAGTPVIASNTTSVPEVVGESGMLVEPCDKKAFAAAIVSVLSDCSLRNLLVERGHVTSARFQWAATAADLRDEMQELARSSGRTRQ